MTEIIISQASKEFASNLDDRIERWVIRNQVEAAARQILYLNTEDFRSYLKKFTREQLLDLKNELDALNTKIRNQRVKRSNNCMAGYHEWLQAANAVQKLCGAYSQFIQLEISSRPKPPKERRDKWKKRVDTTEKCFIDIAREQLDRDTFSNILKSALERSGNSHLTENWKSLPKQEVDE